MIFLQFKSANSRSPLGAAAGGALCTAVLFADLQLKRFVVVLILEEEKEEEQQQQLCSNGLFQCLFSCFSLLMLTGGCFTRKPRFCGRVQRKSEDAVDGEFLTGHLQMYQRDRIVQ